MTAAATILTIALLAKAGAAQPAPLTVVEEVERVTLGAVGATLRVQAMTGEILLTSPSAAQAAALLKAVGASRLCPLAVRSGSVVILRCTTHKLDVSLSGGALDIRKLRGLPWRDADDGPPRFTYDPSAVGLGEGCPGDSPAGMGECALAAGNLVAAERFFTEAYASFEQRSPAALRLGDLALRRNDVKTALDLYLAAGAAGPFGQLAVQRRHELLGLPAKELYLDRARLPEAMLVEVDLRHARSLAFAGLEGEAARLLEARLGEPGKHALCSADDHLCRRIALVALRSQDEAARAEGLSLYSALTVRAEGMLAAELAKAAADVAAELGAPLYGANALAATVRAASPSELGPHLLRAAELFNLAGEPARRDVILEYARLRLPQSELGSPAFRKLFEQPRRPRAHKPQKSANAASAASPESDLAAAHKAIEAARAAGTDRATEKDATAAAPAKEEGKP